MLTLIFLSIILTLNNQIYQFLFGPRTNWQSVAQDIDHEMLGLKFNVTSLTAIKYLTSALGIFKLDFVDVLSSDLCLTAFAIFIA